VWHETALFTLISADVTQLQEDDMYPQSARDRVVVKLINMQFKNYIG
jgi:hypothetical protein